MKQKLRVFLTLLLCAVASVGWAESYTITFKSTGETGDGTAVNSSTQIADIISSGASYVSSFSDVTNAYSNGHYGLKLGTSKNPGSITFNLSTNVIPTSIIVNAKRYNESKAATISINDETAQDLTAEFSDYTFEPSSEISQIKFSSSKYCWISSITVNYGSASTATATPTFSPAAGTYIGAQNVTISCDTDGSSIYYTTDGSEPSSASTLYENAINVTSTTTIKAIAVKEGMDNSAVATATYTIVTLEHAGTAEDPYTVADARNAIDANTGVTDVYATGIVSEIVTAYSSQYSNITFDLVDEEGNSETVQAYRCTGEEAANVQVGDVVVVKGNLTKYNTTYEFAQGCEIVSRTSSSTQVAAGLAFSASTASADLSDLASFTAPTLVNPNNLPVIYTSSNTEVATVAADGTVTIKAEGKTTITASSEETEQYLAGTASYTLTVTNSNKQLVTVDAEGNITFDLSDNGWEFPTSKQVEEGSYTCDGYTIKVAGSEGGGFYFYNDAKALLMGKEDAYLSLPAFDMPVQKIEVVGSSKAGTSVKQNIFVGETAVSTETTGAKDVTNVYEIAEDYQAAGNVYTLKVTSAHNTQITSIKVYKGVVDERTPVTLTFSNVPETIEKGQTATYTATSTPAVSDITYTSNSANVTVNESTGEITAAELGEATITATFAGNTEYKPATASYTITVVAPKHIAKFFVNGVEQTAAQVEVSEGAAITFPANPSAINNKEFVGWTDAKIDGEQDEAPATLVKAANMGTADVTYYAVFAKLENAGSITNVTDELTRETTGVTSGTSSYSNWSDKKVTSDAIYAGNSAGGNDAIQLRSNNSNSGVVTTTSGGKARKVTVTWNENTLSGRTLNVYGSNTAYSAATDLYVENAGTLLGTIVNGTSTELIISGNYEYIGLRSAENAMYLNSISITWETGTPATYSGYCTAFDESTKSAYAAITATTVDGTTTRDVTFYYDTKKNSRAGEGVTIETIGTSTEYNTWAGQMLKTATFDASFIDYTDLTSTINFFNNCKNLEKINGLTNLNTSNVTDMTQMFRYCSKLANLDLSGFNTSNVEYMTNMFAYSLLENITFGSNFKTDKVKNMTGMFSNCRMTSLDLSHENTSNEPNKCKFNTANVSSMNDMFYYCINMTNLDVSNFNTENVKYMEATFAGLEKVTELDLSNFNTANVTDMRNMFSHHSSTLPLTTIWVGDGWNTDKVTGTSGNSMFLACYNLYGGEGTKCSYTNGTGVALARIDGKGGKGYLSDKNNKYVTVGSTGYTTYVPKANVTIPSDVTAYIVTEVKESSIHMEPVTGAIPAGTPIVVKADQNWYKLPIAESATAVSGNLLLASDGNVTGDGSTIYALGVGKEGDAAGKVGFYRVKSGAKVPAGKAYLNTSDGAKDFLNFDFGETDGIGQIEMGQTSNAEIYNLSGQKVNKAQKGIYIVNGKKVVIR